MIISATGIVIDHYGDVLLIQRDDTRTLAPPGGAAHIGELPPDTVAREVREETGLIVMAVRLVGLYYLPTKPNSFLALVFRSIMRGGKIETSEESPHVGFFKTDPLPQPMLSIHANRIQRSLQHKGGAPYWGTDHLSSRLRLGNFLLNRVVYPWLHFRRRLAGVPAYEPPATWQTEAAVILRNKQGDVLWAREQADDDWILPGGASAEEEPPWNTAARAVGSLTGTDGKLQDLAGVYPAPNRPTMTFAFSGTLNDKPTGSPKMQTAYFSPGDEPATASQQHVAFVQDATTRGEEPVYHLLGKIEEA